MLLIHFEYEDGWRSVKASSTEVAVREIRRRVPSVKRIMLRSKTLWEKENGNVRNRTTELRQGDE